MRKIRLLSIILVLFLFGCIEKQENTKIFFCPEDQCEERNIYAINNAEHSIDVAIYSFTSEKIAKALIDAQKRGVECRIVIDYLQSKSKYSMKDTLEKAGLKVRVSSPDKVMHNKFAVIDDYISITGSFNWTKNANTKNDENLVFIFDKENAELFKAEFFEIWIDAG